MEYKEEYRFLEKSPKIMQLTASGAVDLMGGSCGGSMVLVLSYYAYWGFPSRTALLHSDLICGFLFEPLPDVYTKGNHQALFDRGKFENHGKC